MITTTGTTPKQVTSVNPSDPAASIDAHRNKVRNATLDGSGELETSWVYNSEGDEKVVTTTQNSGESDTNFKLRHIGDFLLEMISCPPVA